MIHHAGNFTKPTFKSRIHADHKELTKFSGSPQEIIPDVKRKSPPYNCLCLSISLEGVYVTNINIDHLQVLVYCSYLIVSQCPI